MKQIKLSNGKIAKIDDKYFEKFSKYKWAFNPPKKGRNTGYVFRHKLKEDIWNSVHIKMHRYIMFLEGHNIENKKIDHKDGNGLNNQVENLRVVTNTENQRNSIKYKNNKSGYKGVHLNKEGKWVAQIRCGKKQQIYLGSFKNKEDAAKAYNEAAIKYHGEFANLNIII